MDKQLFTTIADIRQLLSETDRKLGELFALIKNECLKVDEINESNSRQTPYLTISELADYLKVSKRTVSTLNKKGVLNSAVLMIGRRKLYNVEKIKHILNK